MKDAATASPDLSALIASRIVHDLTSPLGAVGNGLEMLELSGTPAGPEIDLIAQSVALAKARLRFLRLAFGAAAPGQLVSGSEIAAALSGPVGAARLAIDWQPADGAERTLVKLAFLSLMCLESAMPFGGSVTVPSPVSTAGPRSPRYLNGRRAGRSSAGETACSEAPSPVPRARCSLPDRAARVAMPISAPMPNSPPSANWVEALRIRMALSSRARNVPRRHRPRSGWRRCAGCRSGGYGRSRRPHRRPARTAMIESRNSRPKSSCPAGTTPGRWRRPSPARTSTPAATRSATSCAPSPSAIAVDQQAFGGAADAGAPGLGVQHHAARLGGIGGGIDIDVADAFEMGEYRHPGLGLHQPDQPLAAARHDHVDMFVHAQHGGHRGAVARGHQLDRRRGQTGGRSPSTRQPCSAVEEWKLSDPPRRITALPAFRHSAPASAVTLGRDS
jgi:hypothetical protein